MIKKTGSPSKIKEVVTNNVDFDRLKEKIAKDNNLKLCSCGQLLAKFDSENKTINIQKRKLEIIADVQNAKIKCPGCGKVTSV